MRIKTAHVNRIIATVLMLAALPGVAAAFDHLELTVVDPIVVDGNPAATAGAGFSVRVRAVNADGTTDTAADYINANLLSPDVPTDLPAAAYLQNGERQFDGVAFLASGQPVRLQVEDMDDASVPVAEILMNCYEPVDHLVIDVPAGDKYVGQPLTITVTAEDAAGDPVRNFADDVTLDAAIGDFASGPTITIPGASFNSGVTTISVTLQGTDPVTRDNNLAAVGSVVYPGQAFPAHGQVLVTPLHPGNLSTIVLLLPGETLTPGVYPGKSGTPLAQISGAIFDGVDVYATDQYWNPIEVGPYPHLTWTCNDPSAGVVLPPDLDMTSNVEQDLGMTLIQSGTTRVEVAATGTGGEFSESWVEINPEGLDHFEFDYAVWDTTETQVTTIPFQVRVRARDMNDNLFPFNGAVSMRVKIGETDESADYLIFDTATFVDGVLDSRVQVTKRAFSANLIIDSNGGVVGISGGFQVNAGPLDRILFTFPGEAWLPGLNDPAFSGNLGVPNTFTAGQIIDPVVLRPVDRFGNLVSGSRTVTLSCPTGYFELPDHPDNMLTLSSPTDLRMVFRTHGDQVLQGDIGAIGTSLSNPVPVAPDVFQRIVIEAPGEQLEPGIFDSLENDGKIGTPASQDAGVAFNARVYAVDAYWNPIASSSPALPRSLDFSSTDAAAVLPASPQSLMTPSALFPLTLQTLVEPNEQTVQVADLGSGAEGYTVIPVSPGVIDHFDIGINSQTNPAPADVLQPIPDHQAGSWLPNVTVVARDVFGNHVTSFTDSVSLSVSHGTDVMAPLRISMADGFGSGSFEGVWRNQIRIARAGVDVHLEVREDVYGRTGISNDFTVFAGPYDRIQLLLPGEAATPGVSPGKIGVPLPVAAGDTLTARVQSVDAFWNPVPSEPIVHIGCDSFFEMVSLNNSTLAPDGSGDFQLAIRTAGDRTLEAYDLASPSRVDSSLVRVDPAAFAGLQIVAPGETPLPGGFEIDGKTGLPDPRIAALQFPISVYSVDRFWNRVSRDGGGIRVVSDDGSLSDSNPLNNGNPLVDGEIIFPISLGSIGYVTVTATDDDDPGIVGQSVVFSVEEGAQYLVAGPAAANVGPPGTFAMSVQLVDGGGQVITTAQTDLMIRALGTDLQPVDGALLITEGRLVDGELDIPAQAYDTVEPIVIEVSDFSGRKGYSDPITMLDNGFEYVVSAQTDPAPRVGPPATFPVTVTLRDRETRTTIDDGRLFNIEIYDETGAQGAGEVGTVLQRLEHGVLTFDQSYTRAENIYLRVWDDTGLVGYSPLFPVAPDGYKRLQILAPGETAHPGDPAFSATGKDGSPDAQRPGETFPIQVLAVDQFWNVADTTSVGTVHLDASDGSFAIAGNPDANDQSFINGARSFSAFLTKAGPVAVTASDLADAARTPQTSTVDLVDPYYYEIEVPANASTGPIPGFAMTIRLIDPLTGFPQPSAFNDFTLEPLRADLSAGAGDLGVTSGSLVNGVAVINNQSYSALESLVIRMTDDYGREIVSDVIDMQTGGLYYAVTVPESATVGGPDTFPVEVELMDSNTGQRVVTQGGLIDIEIIGAATGLPAAGAYGIHQQTYSGGYCLIDQTYTLAEEIFVRVSDAEGITGVSNTCRMLPDGFKRLQILAPGETAVPGAVDDEGRSGAPEPQYVGVPFPVRILAVDQYYNVLAGLDAGAIELNCSVDEWLHLVDPADAGAAFVGGSRTIDVVLAGVGQVSLFASDAETPEAVGGVVDVQVRDAMYLVDLPDPPLVTTGPPATFNMGVRLVDSEDGSPIEAGGGFGLTALKPDWSAAAAELGVVSGNLSAGAANVNHQTYGISEQIVIKAFDDYGREGYSDVLTVYPVSVEYDISAPDTVVAGQTWPLAISRIDGDTGEVVSSSDVSFSLTAHNAWTGDARPDVALNPSGTLAYQMGATDGGTVTFANQSYDRAEVIYLSLEDNEGGAALSGQITVLPGDAAALVVDLREDDGGAFSGVMRPDEVVTVTAQVDDVHGNAIPGLSIDFEVLEGDGSVGPARGAELQVTTRADGLAVASLRTDADAEADILLQVSCPGMAPELREIPVAGPPATEIGYEGVASDYSDGKYVSFDTRITLTAHTDAPGGIRAVFLDIDHADGALPATAYAGPFTLAELIPDDTGLHVLRFFAEEVGGVREVVQEVNLYTTAALASDKQITNRPNPFRAGKEPTLILFNPPADGPARMIIYDLYGATVTTANIEARAGVANQFTWDGRDGDGDVVANGGYICRITGTGYDIRRKIAVVK